MNTSPPIEDRFGKFSVCGIAFSPDGQRLLITDTGNRVIVGLRRTGDVIGNFGFFGHRRGSFSRTGSQRQQARAQTGRGQCEAHYVQASGVHAS